MSKYFVGKKREMTFLALVDVGGIQSLLPFLFFAPHLFPFLTATLLPRFSG
jgi:hypothetical protein